MKKPKRKTRTSLAAKRAAVVINPAALLATIQQTCGLLNVGRSSIYELIESGDLDSRHVCGRT